MSIFSETIGQMCVDARKKKTKEDDREVKKQTNPENNDMIYKV
jgi:hypothetical protein